MTDNAIRHYFQDFPAWCAIKNITDPKHDDVVDWAAELVMDNFISEDEAAELVAAAKEYPDLMKVPSLSGNATVAAAEAKGADEATGVPSDVKDIATYIKSLNPQAATVYDAFGNASGTVSFPKWYSDTKKLLFPCKFYSDADMNKIIKQGNAFISKKFGEGAYELALEKVFSNAFHSNCYAVRIKPAAGGTANGDVPPDESAAALGVSPVVGLKKSVEAFANKAVAAIKGVYNSNSVMMEDCEQDVLDLNGAISGLRSCVEKAAESLKAIHKSMSYQKNEDTMKAIALLSDAIKEIAGDTEGEDKDDNADGAPDDSLSSEVSAIYNDEPTPPNSVPDSVEEPEI